MEGITDSQDVAWGVESDSSLAFLAGRIGQKDLESNSDSLLKMEASD